MGDVVHLPRPKLDVKAVTCGCDGQTFILVVDADKQPDFIYCVECQHRMSTVMWRWVEPPKPAA